MDLVSLTIDGVQVQVPAGTTVLEAARLANIQIPTLCYLKDVSCVGSCRMCVVEATGARGLVAACVYPVAEGMEVRTNTEKCRESRKMTLELLLSKHKKKCLSCERNHNCELQKLSLGYGVDEDRFKGEDFVLPIDTSAPYVVRDNDKCINCMRCVAASRSDPNCVNTMSSRYCERSSRSLPLTFFMPLICALLPTRDTESPTLSAGRTPALNSSLSR